MNYIRHLNGFFERLAEDERLSSYHISLYIALFQQWNANRFRDQFTISRTEVMQLARIGSANTYARCMKELTDWGYIAYFPSSNLHSGSKVSCIRFDSTSDTAGNTVGDTCIKSDTSASTATDTASNTGTESNTVSDTATNTAADTGTSGNLKADIGGSTATDTGIKTDTTGSTGSDTATGTGITANTETDTATSTATRENEPVGIKSDTGTDTASDTLFINITNKNKQEEKSVRRNQKEDFAENEKNEKQTGKTNTENSSSEKFQIPDLLVVEQFFEQNRSSGHEARNFYAHYQSTGWKTGDMKRILSWQAVARKWMNNTHENTNNEREFNKVGTGNLSVTVNKNYNEPL
jgi:hypothetical protein